MEVASAAGDGATGNLLGAGDPPPVRIQNSRGKGWFLFTGDHAGNRVPQRLAQLGLPPEQLERHIAIDGGVSELGRLLATRCDSPFVEQRYSRLVIDCNRSPQRPDSSAAISDEVPVPGNVGLSAEALAARRTEVFEPYHAAIARVLAERTARRQPTIFVALHSFTPVMAGKARPWQIGVLHGGGDARYAKAVLAELEAERGWVVGDNVPYSLNDIDFTVPHHAFAAGLPYVEIEVRRDELAATQGVKAVAALLERALVAAAAVLD